MDRIEAWAGMHGMLHAAFGLSADLTSENWVSR